MLDMKLKNRNEVPIGGFYYDDPITGETIVTDGNFDKLLSGVKAWYKLKGVPEPDRLKELIEDQICTRQPPGKCYYTKGVGDQIAKAIHTVAAVIDSAAGTNLQTRARSCGKCSKRRVMIN